ncbi:hypothetical protein CWS02_04920 [Enterobacter sp. EA-1]|nr:hypothetical protein CWS02_04920 [Enterobacter sp. EA-1]
MVDVGVRVKKITIKDIAKLANVSHGTVSKCPVITAMSAPKNRCSDEGCTRSRLSTQCQGQCSALE